MLKKVFFVVCLITLVSFSGVLPTLASNSGKYIPYDVSLWVDNQLVKTDREYLTQDGHMLVPAQAVVEMMGASINWVPGEARITIQSETEKLTMYIANYQVANGTRVDEMPAQPTLLRGTVMIPLRYVAESLGATVIWDGATRSVTVSTTGESQITPEGNLQMTKTIVLDPGHGGSDPGAVARKIQEKDLNLEVSKVLRDLLNDAGYKVYMTRTEDKYVGLYTRAAIANNLKADLFVSIHHNASPDTGTHGVMTLYYPSSKTQQMNGTKFAQIVQKNMVNVLKSRDLGTIPRPNLVVTRETKMPSVIAELGYMSNKAELERMVTPEFQQQAAKSLFDGIVEALQH